MIATQPIATFLDDYPKKATRRAYTSALKKFFRFIDGEITDFETQAVNYLTSDRDIKTDIKQFSKSLSGKAPLTWSLYINALRVFLRENTIRSIEPERENRKFWDRLKLHIGGPVEAITQDVIPTNKQLRKIVGYMTLSGKALFSLLATSGMRVGEALGLKQSDIDLDIEGHPEIMRINLSRKTAKKGGARVTYANHEAKELMKDWIKHRPAYLKQAIVRCALYDKTKDDPRVFPFNYANAVHMFNTALKNAGLNGKDEDTNRERIHVHSLRKFFSTNLSKAKVMPESLIEQLLGHNGNDVKNAYKKYTAENIMNQYEESMYVLSIFSDAENVKKIKERVDRAETKLDDSLTAFHDNSQITKVAVESLTKEILELREREKQTQARLERIEAQDEELGRIFTEILGDPDLKARLQKVFERHAEKDKAKTG